MKHWVERRYDWRNPSHDGVWTSRQYFHQPGATYEVTVYVVPVRDIQVTPTSPAKGWGVTSIPRHWQKVTTYTVRMREDPGNC